jgi:uncharacterized DUF497 family protein
LRQIVEKIEAKHRVTHTEAEEVFSNAPQFRRLEKGRIEGEDVYAAYGATDAGRYLAVVFIRKVGSRALIITARDMDHKERKQYGK